MICCFDGFSKHSYSNIRVVLNSLGQLISGSEFTLAFFLILFCKHKNLRPSSYFFKVFVSCIAALLMNVITLVKVSQMQKDFQIKTLR